MNVDRARQLQAANLELMARKSQDYGTKNIEITGTYGVAVRLQDKVSRVLNLTQKGVEANYESLADTFCDIANYGLIGQLLLSGDFSDGPNTTGPGEGPSSFPRVKEDPSGDVGEGSGEDSVVGYDWSFQYETEPEEYNRLVYLAGPIDNVTGKQAKKWRRVATKRLVASGLGVFNPANAVVNGNSSRQAVHRVCREAVLASGVVLAYLPDDYRAFGTIREIEFARANGIAVVIASPWVSNSVFSEDVLVLPELDDAIGVIIAALADVR